MFVVVCYMCLFLFTQRLFRLRHFILVVFFYIRKFRHYLHSTFMVFELFSIICSHVTYVLFFGIFRRG